MEEGIKRELEELLKMITANRQPFSPVNRPKVIVDLETTSFYADADIIQIAAKCGDKEFNRYMLPQQQIDYQASLVNQFTVENNILYYQGNRVQTTSPLRAGKKFLDFLNECGAEVILLGHNVIRFDAPRIVEWLKSLGLLEKFQERTYGFCDTMPILAQGRMKKLVLLANNFLTDPSWRPILTNAHDALVDCLLVDGLLKHFNISEAVINEKTITLEAFLEHLEEKRIEKEYLWSLKASGIEVTLYMMKKMAAARIGPEDLLNTFEVSGRDGIRTLLTTPSNGRPRVTLKNDIIETITNGVENLARR